MIKPLKHSTQVLALAKDMFSCRMMIYILEHNNGSFADLEDICGFSTICKVLKISTLFEILLNQNCT